MVWKCEMTVSNMEPFVNLPHVQGSQQRGSWPTPCSMVGERFLNKKVEDPHIFQNRPITPRNGISPSKQWKEKTCLEESPGPQPPYPDIPVFFPSTELQSLNTRNPMEKGQDRSSVVLMFSFLIFLGLISCASCITAEFKRAKKKDLKLDGKLCHLPASPAFGYAVAALVCLSMAQIIGNLIICTQFHSFTGEKSVSLPTCLLVISWISFGTALLLIAGATSMSRRQPYGEGWLAGECYLVKDGVFLGSAALTVVAVGSTLGSAFVIIRERQVEPDRNVHAKI